MTTRSRGAVAAVLLAALVGLSACQGSDEPPRTDPTTDATTASPGPTDTTPSPSVEPATGELVDLRALTYHLPAGIPWTFGPTGRSVADYQKNPGTRPITVLGSETPVFSGSPATLDYAADLVLRDESRFTHPLQRGQDRTVGNVTGWTATTRTGSRNDRVLMWGTVRNGYYFYLSVTGADDVETKAMFESILASIEWK
ncbi:hypothetical protein GCM10022237_51400 [Nocardioides ginsengisoli]|uniref:DUF1795 domain-containing protein n=1 Tax=Nocardioides ginsengisoli TaxID=363868 RepID=A0ABW3VVW2_9ACTN